MLVPLPVPESDLTVLWRVTGLKPAQVAKKMEVEGILIFTVCALCS